MAKLSRKDFIEYYFNFRVLRVSNKNNNMSTNRTIVDQGIKRKARSDITDNVTCPSEYRGSSNNHNNLVF